MDLSSKKVTPEDKVDLCKKYFYLGWAFLPFLWGVNAVWFYREAFSKPEFEGQKTIKKLVIMSGVGALVWLVGLITWIAVFTINRADWGATADYMSFNIPLGKP